MKHSHRSIDLEGAAVIGGIVKRSVGRPGALLNKKKKAATKKKEAPEKKEAPKKEAAEVKAPEAPKPNPSRAKMTDTSTKKAPAKKPAVKKAAAAKPARPNRVPPLSTPQGEEPKQISAAQRKDMLTSQREGTFQPKQFKNQA